MTFPVLVLLALAPIACDDGKGGNDGGDFEPTEPYDDVCSLLTTADVAGAIMAPGPGMVEQTPPDSADFWSRICQWHENDDPLGLDIELVLEGALSEDGLIGIQVAAASLGDQREEVSGVGDHAAYWLDTQQGTAGFVALRGSLMVDMTAYFFDPPPTKAQLQPLLVKVLGEL
jgi:hypothetical protein